MFDEFRSFLFFFVFLLAFCAGKIQQFILTLSFPPLELFHSLFFSLCSAPSPSSLERSRRQLLQHLKNLFLFPSFFCFPSGRWVGWGFFFLKLIQHSYNINYEKNKSVTFHISRFVLDIFFPPFSFSLIFLFLR